MHNVVSWHQLGVLAAACLMTCRRFCLQQWLRVVSIVLHCLQALPAANYTPASRVTHLLGRPGDARRQPEQQSRPADSGGSVHLRQPVCGQPCVQVPIRVSYQRHQQGGGQQHPGSIPKHLLCKSSHASRQRVVLIMVVTVPMSVSTFCLCLECMCRRECKTFAQREQNEAHRYIYLYVLIWTVIHLTLILKTQTPCPASPHSCRYHLLWMLL